MPFKLAEAYVAIRGDTAKFSASVRNAKRDTFNFSRTAKSALKGVAIGIGAVTVAATAAATVIGVKLTRSIMNVTKESVLMAAKFERLKKGLSAVMNSSVLATAELKELREVAKMPGLGFAEAVQGSINLQAVGFNAEEARKILLSFGNALVTVGKGRVELDGVILALTQMRAKGKVLAEEINQLAERVPQVRKVMMDTFGTGATEDIQKMGVSVEEFIEKMVVGLNRLPKAGGGISNEFENITDNIDQLRAAFGNLFLPAVGKVLSGLSEIVEKLTTVVTHFKTYQREATAVFMKVGIIGLNTTMALMRSMSTMVLKMGLKMWQPLVYGLSGVAFELEKKLQDLSISVLEKLGMSQETAAKRRKEIADKYAESMKLAAAATNVAIDEASRAGIEIFKSGVRDMGAEWESFVKEVSAALDPLVTKIEKAQKATSGAAKTVKYDFSKAVGNINTVVNKVSPGQFKLAMGGFSEMAKSLAKAFGMAGQESDSWKRKMSRFREEQQEKWQDFANTFAAPFESAFASILGGNTKNMWKQFWTDMKNTAIRALAQIAVAKILGSFIPGGQVAGMGLGRILGMAEGGIVTRPTIAMIGEKGPEAVVPLSGSGARGVGGVTVQTLNITFPNATLETMDNTQIDQILVRKYLPRLHLLASDGIS